MSEQDGREPAAQSAEARAELARLRDRTDELELIISSLTTVALFTLPGWLFERFATAYMHLSVPLAVSGSTTVIVLSGLCYGLGACFLLHLLTRAYWVGLIGLRAVSPRASTGIARPLSARSAARATSAGCPTCRRPSRARIVWPRLCSPSSA